MATVTKLKSEPIKEANKASAFTARFVLERETTGALRYMQVTEDGAPFSIGEGAQMGTSYIRKSAFGKNVPKAISIEVTVTE